MNYAESEDSNLDQGSIEVRSKKRAKKELPGSQRQEIIVGSLKDDMEVTVYGYLTGGFALKYCLDEEKARKSIVELSHRMHPTFQQVEFIADYGTSEQEIKEEIKKQLKGKAPENQGVYNHRFIPSLVDLQCLIVPYRPSQWSLAFRPE
jgi:hypothetical protein